jgi:hypothetical protein
MRLHGTENRRTTALIEAAVEILDAESPMTIRQLFYRLVSRGFIPNDRKHYQLVSRVMTKARDDGRCSFDHIVDRSRPEYSPNVFTDAGSYADVVQRAYRKDYWAMQPNHVEVWVENRHRLSCYTHPAGDVCASTSKNRSKVEWFPKWFPDEERRRLKGRDGVGTFDVPKK